MADRDNGLEILADIVRSGSTIRARLVVALDRVARLGPLTEGKVAALTPDEVDLTDIVVLRFASLASLVGDHLIRGILLAEGENLAGTSRRDQRHMAERLGALDPALDLQAVANLRNRVAHQYPTDPARQASLLTAIVDSTPAVIAAFDDLAAFANRRLFGGTLDLPRESA